MKFLIIKITPENESNSRISLVVLNGLWFFNSMNNKGIKTEKRG
jgi:hypothetical protein